MTPARPGRVEDRPSLVGGRIPGPRGRRHGAPIPAGRVPSARTVADAARRERAVRCAAGVRQRIGHDDGTPTVDDRGGPLLVSEGSRSATASFTARGGADTPGRGARGLPEGRTRPFYPRPPIRH